MASIISFWIKLKTYFQAATGWVARTATFGNVIALSWVIIFIVIGVLVVEELERYPLFGAIGYHLNKIILLQGKYECKTLSKIVSERLPPTDFVPDCPEKVRENWHFLQDNDPKHKSKIFVIIV